MPSSIPHQKFCFYHLPTRGRAGIKLGDAWYVSDVSIIFDCSMLYYLLFWTLLGFIIHFYIIFGTNLLTGAQPRIVVFCLFQSFAEKNIKWSPNRMKPSGTWFSHRTWSRRLGPYSKKCQRRSRGWRAPPLGRAPLPRGPPVAPPYSFLLYIPTYPRQIIYGAKNLIPPPQPSLWTIFDSSLNSFLYDWVIFASLFELSFWFGQLDW